MGSVVVWTTTSTPPNAAIDSAIQALDVEIVGKVDAHGDRRPSRGDDLCDGRFDSALMVEVGHDDGPRPPGQPTRDVAAGGGRAARDDRHGTPRNGRRHEHTLVRCKPGCARGRPGRYAGSDPCCGPGSSRAQRGWTRTTLVVRHRFIHRAGKGKSDPIDAHLAVLAALRLDADRLPTPRADGDREALRILLGAGQELTTASTAQTNRLRALLLGGDDTDRQLARAALTDTRLASLSRRRPPREASREQAVRHAEIRRLALALREAARAVKANRASCSRQGQPGPAADHRQRRRSRVARASWHRPGQRRPGHRVVLPPWTVPQRRGVRRPGRRQPAAGQQRPHRAAPAQPGRGPRPEPGPAHHRRDTDAQLPEHPGLRRPAHRRGQEPEGDFAAASSGTSPASSSAPSPPLDVVVLIVALRSIRGDLGSGISVACGLAGRRPVRAGRGRLRCAAGPLTPATAQSTSKIIRGAAGRSDTSRSVTTAIMSNRWRGLLPLARRMFHTLALQNPSRAPPHQHDSGLRGWAARKPHTRSAPVPRHRRRRGRVACASFAACGAAVLADGGGQGNTRVTYWGNPAVDVVTVIPATTPRKAAMGTTEDYTSGASGRADRQGKDTGSTGFVRATPRSATCRCIASRRARGR